MHNLSTLIINSRCFFTRIIPVLCIFNATNSAYADDEAFALRINVGGEEYTDSTGHLWQADTGFNTGNLSSSAIGSQITGTDDLVLYQSARWDAGAAPELRYSFNVPDGEYTVRLHFADSYIGTQGEGLRVFDVALEDQRVLENLDIFAEVGGNAALVKTLTTQVNDGTLDIEFLHQVENPAIRAIEIYKSTVFRINVGGADYTDSAGQLWQADKGFNTGNLSGSAANATYRGTADQVLYQSARWDADDAPELRYSFDVPNGSYAVRLHFADSYSGTQGEDLRVFDVALEDQLALENLDIFAEVGGNAALIKTLTTQVNDGTLDIEFLHQVENPEIRAIEIEQLADRSATPGVVNITREAEDYSDVSDADNDGVDDFTQGSRADASNGAYMQAKGQRENSYLEYQVNLPADDVYEIAVRGTGTSKGSDSFFVSVDGGVSSAVHLNSDDSWSWKTVTDANSGLGPYSLSKGNHRIRIRQRERNAKIDQLSITNTAGTSLPALNLSRARIDFGSVVIGSVSGSETVRLTNSGTRPLNIVAMEASTGFTQRNDCGNFLDTGGSCTINVQFTPSRTGNLTGALNITSDAANSPARVNLAGRGADGSGGSQASLRPYSDNNYYWEYKGEPVLLLGAFNGAHNVFLRPDVDDPSADLATEMDEMLAAGGNVIRVVFDPGAAVRRGFGASHQTTTDGQFDLNKFTSGSDSYWGEFETLLVEAQSRDIIVQLEVWDRFDMQKDNWLNSPFRPANNINYTASQSGLANSYSSFNDTSFAFGVPGHPEYESASASRRAQFDLVRGFQEKRVDQLLSISLRYNNILYTMNNETHEDPAWGHYWMEHIQNAASLQGKTVYVTDMFDNGIDNFRTNSNYNQVFTGPDSDRYTFIDISQNNTEKKVGGAEGHWRDLMYTRNQTSSSIRPVNNIKIYAADSIVPSPFRKQVNTRFGDLSAQNSFWMNIIGGSALARFHRPGGGQGLSALAKVSISAARKLETRVRFWELEPRNDLLSNRGTFTVDFPGIDFRKEPFVYGEAYLAADIGKTYALYFTRGGSVGLDLGAYPGVGFRIDWLNIDDGQWGPSSTVSGGSILNIAAPDGGAWVAAIVRSDLSSGSGTP
ncbi:Cell division protein FtsI [Peptidoglycan synthetase] [hydrothermal vent metagenome]|uniref:Cell division protein FtsI [Peptidoglycan synthetase] n=1 Tax=hydrothermal vent metagenome TaxID=652676 RepID=A0A3B0XDI4_9ZZZZ